VGVITYWCYFLWIITNNFTNVIVFFGTKIPPYTTFLCTKFQGNRITRFHFMVTFMKRRKKSKKKKNEETLSTFIFGNIWHDLVEIWNVGYWRWRASQQQKQSVSYKHHEVTYMQKLHYCSSCQYTHSVVHWLLGPHDATVCLDIHNTYENSQLDFFNFRWLFHFKSTIIRMALCNCQAYLCAKASCVVGL